MFDHKNVMDFFGQDTITVAKELLGKKILYRNPEGLVGGYIVETEAYLGYDDPACHSVGGMTPRTEVMFKGAGLVYIYFIYGMHYCLNFTTAAFDKPEAVLIRAVEPGYGIDIMTANRLGKSLNELCNGPGKLTQAMGIDKRINGTKIGDELLLAKGKSINHKDIVKKPRIGITKAADRLLRFYVKGSLYISKK